MPRTPPEDLRRELSNAAIAVGALYKSAKTAYDDGYTDALRLVKNFVLLTQYCQHKLPSSASSDGVRPQHSHNRGDVSQRQTEFAEGGTDETAHLYRSSHSLENLYGHTDLHPTTHNQTESMYCNDCTRPQQCGRNPMPPLAGRVDAPLLLSFLDRHMKHNKTETNNLSVSEKQRSVRKGQIEEQENRSAHRQNPSVELSSNACVSSSTSSITSIGPSLQENAIAVAPTQLGTSVTQASSWKTALSSLPPGICNASGSKRVRPVCATQHRRSAVGEVKTPNSEVLAAMTNDVRRQHNEVIACVEVDSERFCQPPPRKRRRTRIHPAVMWATWVEAMHLGSEDDDSEDESSDSSDSNECGATSDSSTSAIREHLDEDDV